MGSIKLKIFQPGCIRNFQFLPKQEARNLLVNSATRLQATFPRLVHDYHHWTKEFSLSFYFKFIWLSAKRKQRQWEAKSDSVKINEDFGHNRAPFIHHVRTSLSPIRGYDQFLDNSCTKLSYNLSFKTSQSRKSVCECMFSRMHLCTIHSLSY